MKCHSIQGYTNHSAGLLTHSYCVLKRSAKGKSVGPCQPSASNAAPRCTGYKGLWNSTKLRSNQTPAVIKKPALNHVAFQARTLHRESLCCFGNQPPKIAAPSI